MPYDWESYAKSHPKVYERYQEMKEVGRGPLAPPQPREVTPEEAQAIKAESVEAGKTVVEKPSGEMVIISPSRRGQEFIEAVATTQQPPITPPPSAKPPSPLRYGEGVKIISQGYISEPPPSPMRQDIHISAEHIPPKRYERIPDRVVPGEPTTESYLLKWGVLPSRRDLPEGTPYAELPAVQYEQARVAKETEQRMYEAGAAPYISYKLSGIKDFTSQLILGAPTYTPEGRVHRGPIEDIVKFGVSAGFTTAMTLPYLHEAPRGVYTLVTQPREVIGSMAKRAVTRPAEFGGEIVGSLVSGYFLGAAAGKAWSWWKGRGITKTYEVGQYTYGDLWGRRVGYAPSKVVIAKKGKPIMSAELETIFTKPKPGQVGAGFTKIEIARPGKLPETMYGWARGITYPETTLLTTRGLMFPGVTPAKGAVILFKPTGKPTGALAAMGFTKKVQDTLKTVGFSITAPGKKPGIFASIFQKIKTPPPKFTIPIKPGKPSPAALTATTEAVGKSLIKEITKAPKVVTEAAGAAPVSGVWARVAAEPSPPIMEEELYISPKAAGVVGVQAMDSRQQELTMQRLGVGYQTMQVSLQKLGMGQGQTERTLQKLGVGQASVTRMGMGVISLQKVGQVQKQRQQTLQKLALRQVTTQRTAMTPFRPIPTTTPTPFIPIPPLMPDRKRGAVPPVPGPIQGFHVFVKRKQYKVGRKRYSGRGYKRVTERPLTQSAALGYGSQIVDKYANRSFKIRPSREPARPAPMLSSVWSSKKHKFRYKIRKRTKVPGVLVEKSRYAIDSPSERRAIPYEAARLRRAGVLETRPRRKRRKRSKNMIRSLMGI